MLDITRLGLAIQAAFVAGGAIPGNPLLVAMSTAMASAIVTELTTNATVLPSGVPPFSNAGGPVAGLGKIA